MSALDHELQRAHPGCNCHGCRMAKLYGEHIERLADFIIAAFPERRFDCGIHGCVAIAIEELSKAKGEA